MRKRKRRTFTLVEILVVIAIIAILMSLLFPALGKARDTAKDAACLGNEKQMSAAIAQYTDDWSGWIPVSSFSGGLYTCWKYALAPYLGIEDATINDARLNQKVFLCPSIKFPPSDGGGYGWSVGNSPDNSCGYYEMNPTRPCETAVCGDGTDWMTGGAWEYNFIYPPSSTLSTYPGPPVGNRHSRGINIVWADLHAAWKSQRDLLAGANGNIDWYYFIKK